MKQKWYETVLTASHSEIGQFVAEDSPAFEKVGLLILCDAGIPVIMCSIIQIIEPLQ